MYYIFKVNITFVTEVPNVSLEPTRFNFKRKADSRNGCFAISQTIQNAYVDISFMLTF